MRERLNSLGQPVGFDLSDWKVPPFPPREGMAGRFCQLESLDVRVHGCDLYEAFATDGEGRMWTYLPYGPFDSRENFQTWMADFCLGADPLFFAIVEQKTGKAIGMTSYLRIAPATGAIEVGHVLFSPILQRTPVATEAMYLMMRRAFDTGYRRYEWKCDALNAKSRAAAERLGFTFEGIFRQAIVYKNRNRDTAWYSVIDSEWPKLKQSFEKWLALENFDERGNQRISLSSLTRAGA
jgi:RimJ/RimL family protein N-acetyltransferase